MTITLNYGVVYGKGDSSDVFEWEIELDEEQEAAYQKAIMTGASFEDFPELQALCDEAYPEIEKQEIENLIEFEDEFTLECLGEIEVDVDEINDLVHSKDPHAIEFFELEGLSDEELEDWDASDLDELPLIKDFEEGFEPESPFDCGWILNVWLPENDEYPDDDEIEQYLIQALSANDIQLTEDIIEGQEDNYSGNIKESAVQIAEQVGCQEFLLKYRVGN